MCLKNQFGFRNKLSTVEAIALLNEKISENWFKDKNLNNCKFIDLKQLSLLNHEILLKKD